MSKQPEALRLADALDNANGNFYAESSLWFDRKLSEATDEAAAELRRLHSINAELLEAAQKVVKHWLRDTDASREALGQLVGVIGRATEEA